MINPMRFVKNELIQYKEEKKNSKVRPSLLQPDKVHKLVGATQENDFQIIQVADHFIIIST
jgi:predicted DNA-binding helix-hairpin-helix protein